MEWSWRDGFIGKGTCCVSLRNEFKSQHLCEKPGLSIVEVGDRRIAGLAGHWPNSRSRERLCLNEMKWTMTERNIVLWPMSDSINMCVHAHTSTHTHTHTHTHIHHTHLHTVRSLCLYLKLSVLLSRLLKLFYLKPMGRRTWWQILVI